MQANLNAAIEAVWQFDGVKDDEAPGEDFVTTYGITADTWQEATMIGVVNKPQAQCTPNDAKAILRALYWSGVSGDQLPSGIDLQCFAHGMLAGQHTAIMNLQRAVGFMGNDVDGIYGPLTLQTVNREYRADPHGLIMLLWSANLSHLKSLAKWNEYGHGWSNREYIMRQDALQLAGVS